jgi:hypothetical protein
MLQEELEQHRVRVFDALRRHSDPVMREIGSQLAGGVLAPHDIVREPHYVASLLRGLRVVADLDDDELRARVLGRKQIAAGDDGEGGPCTAADWPPRPPR